MAKVHIALVQPTAIEVNMFISKAEKEHLISSVKILLEQVRSLSNDVVYLKAKIKAAEGNIFVLKEETKQNKPKVKMTAAQKEKRRSYSRAYYARKKAERLAKKTS